MFLLTLTVCESIQYIYEKKSIRETLNHFYMKKKKTAEHTCTLHTNCNIYCFIVYNAYRLSKPTDKNKKLN